MKPPFFSIVICTYNGSRKIEKCIESILNQAYSKTQYEIIVVDDGSTDNTVEIVNKFEVKLIKQNINRGISVARNAGLDCSKGKVVVCIDDDCTVSPNFLSELEIKYSDPNVVGVAANLVIPRNSSIVDKFFYAIWYGVAVPNQKIKKNIFDRLVWYYKNSPWKNERTGYLDGAPIVDIPAACSSYLKDVLSSVGGWDENLVSASEDNDVSKRIASAYWNKKIILAKKAFVVHHQEMSFVNTLIREFSRVKSRKTYYKKHHQFPVVYPQPLLFILLTILFPKPLFILVLPALLYPWWFYRFLKERNLNYLSFPFFQLLLEISSNLSLLIP